MYSPERLKTIRTSIEEEKIAVQKAQGAALIAAPLVYAANRAAAATKTAMDEAKIAEEKYKQKLSEITPVQKFFNTNTYKAQKKATEEAKQLAEKSATYASGLEENAKKAAEIAERALEPLKSAVCDAKRSRKQHMCHCQFLPYWYFCNFCSKVDTEYTVKKFLDETGI
jgi:hypothetical protein